MQKRMVGNEYRSTVVCVDSYDNHVLAGRMYNPYYGEGKQFNSLIEYMLEMENLLDEMHFPQPFTSRRSFSESDMLQLSVAGENFPEMGKKGTFQVRILFRQNASWQGSVLWMEGDREESFRSVLELALLMDSALSVENV